jgi:carbonic anhydrase/acetyltransferase-like protein (isoleucine patch superfamily)
MEQLYVGSKTPERGAKLLPEAFKNNAPEPTEGVIEIMVVCNDEEMRDEWDAVSEIYGDRDDVYVDVDCRFAVSTDELRDLITKDNDLFHFIGHIDGLGFECPDGILDAKTIEETAATAVLLNGCRSHNQGIALIEAGANATVVSLGDVGNEGAIEVGETLARLLHHGFSVGNAMEIVGEYTSIGENYLVAGNSEVVVAHIKDGTPILYQVSTTKESSSFDDTLIVEPVAYPTDVRNIGTLLVPYLPSVNSKYIAVGNCYKKAVDREEFTQAFLEDKAPMVLDGELIWSDVWLQGH